MNNITNVAFFSFNEWNLPLQVQHELLISHLEQSNRVFFITPKNLMCRDSGDLTNPKLVDFLGYKGKRRQLIEHFSQFDLFKHLNFESHKSFDLSIYPDLNISRTSTVEIIQRLNFEGFNFGYSILSTAASYYNLALHENVYFHKYFIVRMIKSYLSIYLNTIDFLNKNSISCVYVFNGRLLHEKAVINACNKLGIPYKTYEISEQMNSFFLYDGELMTSTNFTEQCMSFYNKQFSPEHLPAVSKWYEDRSSKNAPNLFEINGNIESNYVDEKVFKIKQNFDLLTFFAGSVEELTFDGEQQVQIFSSQESAFSELYRQVKLSGKKIKIVVRTHPKMRLRPKLERQHWSKFLSSFEDVHEVDCDSPTDSYELMRLSDFVVVYQSTMGVESKYFGKRTLILGNSLYTGLPGLEAIKTVDGIKEFLESKKIYTYEIGISMFAFYFLSFGNRFKNSIIFQGMSPLVQRLITFEYFVYLKYYSILHFLVNLRTYYKTFLK